MTDMVAGHQVEERGQSWVAAAQPHLLLRLRQRLKNGAENLRHYRTQPQMPQ